MAATPYVITGIDAETIDAADQALHETGFSLAEAIRIMVSKTARDRRLPFDAEAALEEEYGDEIPNALTRETMRKVLKGEELHKARDLDDLIQQLEA